MRLLRSRLFWKLYASSAVFILLTCGLVSLLAEQRLGEVLIAERGRELRAHALTLAAVIEPRLDRPAEEGDLEGAVASAARRLGVRLTVIAGDGRVLADSERDPAELDNHSRRPEVQAAREGRPRPFHRYSHSARLDSYYYAAAVGSGSGGSEPRAYVRAAIPFAAVSARLSELRVRVLIGAGLAALLGLLLSFFSTRWVLSPLMVMASLVESLEKDRAYDLPLPTGSPDEIGTLGRAFRRLSRSLRRRIDTNEEVGRRLRAVLDGMVEGVIAIDPEARIIHINGVALRLLKVSEPDCLGKRLWEIIRLPRVIAAATVALEGQGGREEIRTFEGSEDRIFELSAAALKSRDGSPGGAVLVLYDLTRLRRLETVRREFVANVSHELKTPLAAIQAVVETMLDDDAMPEATRRRFLGKVSAQSKRLEALIGDVITLSRLESDESSLRFDIVDLRGPIAETVQALSPAAELKEIALTAAVAEAPLRLKGDGEALRQLVGNLVSNAIRYTDEGGRIELRAFAEDGAVVLEVEDNGVGIEPREQKRIFERFYRVDRARSRALGGTGLGLSIVKHIALSLNGVVSVDSAPGRGSLFRVEFPAAGQEVATGGHLLKKS